MKYMADTLVMTVLWDSNDPRDDLVQFETHMSRNRMWSDVQLKLFVVHSANCIYWTLYGMRVLRTVKNLLVP